MVSPPALVIGKRCLPPCFRNAALEPPQKRVMLNRKFDPNNRRLRDEDIEMKDVVPVIPKVSLSSLTPGLVGSRNTVVQVVSACIDLPGPEQRAPDDQGAPGTEVRQYLRCTAY
jgi:hypothetical protein